MVLAHTSQLARSVTCAPPAKPNSVWRLVSVSTVIVSPR
jgi:hypothetical protein